MHVHDQILEFLKITGPTIPTKVAKTINSDIIIASAHLSDLAAQKKVRISSLKFGGSPLYYLSGQEDQLYGFAASNLNPKDMAVLDRLKDEGVLREATLDLLSKVALRALKDFAVPLQVRTPDSSELFWKWHLLPDDTTNHLVREILYPPQAEEIQAPEPTADHAPSPMPLAEEPVPIKTLTPEPLIPQAPVEVEWHVEEESTITQSDQQSIVTYPEINQPKKTRSSRKASSSVSQDATQTVLAEQPTVKTQSPKKTTPPKVEKADPFLPTVERFFRELNITVQEQEIIRRGAEVNLSIKVPTVVGKMTYFCKAKKKARCDEKDLSAAYMEAQVKKLPLLFLYSQELTKKAHEMIATGAFENVIVKKVE